MPKLSELNRGFRESIPIALATTAIGLSFGVLAAPVLGTPLTIVASVVIFAGGAQFAALSVLSTGGSAGVALAAGLMANSRFLPLGFAVAPSMHFRLPGRIGAAAFMTDATFLIGRRADGRFDAVAIAWAAPLQYAGWIIGTLAGVFGASLIGDPATYGLDVIFPVMFLGLLLPEVLRYRPRIRGGWRERVPIGVRRQPLVVAGLAVVITVALVPFTPSGVPVIGAALAALVGLRKPPESPDASGAAVEVAG